MTISNRSRRIMQGNNKPTLLPFLAVLLCTTGALILLLVLIARDVRDSEILPKKIAGKQLSEQTMPVISEINPTQDLDDTKKIISVSEVKETLENLESDIAEAEWMTTQFAESKNELDKQLANAEAYLASVEKQTVQLREEIKRLIELAQKMEQDNNNQQKIDIKSLEQLLQQKNAERELAEKRLTELQKELKDNKKSYAIVPYRGTNGTFRLPVYVECKEDKVIIQPEGIELSMYDFLALDRADNPFDSLLRVARQYYAETGQIERGSEPYPLIIIRPSGVRAFGAAHAAIGNWLKDFGYELVAEDWKMEYPQQNDELRQRMEKQLIVSRQRLQGYVATMRAKNGSGYSHGTGNNKPNEPNNTAEHAGQNNPPINVTNNPNQFNNGNGNGSGNGTREYTISDGVVREVDNSGTVASYLGIDPSQQYGVSRTAINKPNNDNNNLANENNSNNPSDNKSNYPNTASAIPNSSVAGNYISDNSPFDTPNINVVTDINRQETPNATTPNNIATTKTQNQTPNSNPKLAGNVAQDLPLTSTDQAQPITITNQPPATAPPQANVIESSDTWTFRSPVRRNIKIHVGADRFIIVKQAGFDIPRTIMIDKLSSKRSFIMLVDALVDFLETWGIAGERFYWQPVLKIKVLNGGEHQFNELKRQLQENKLNFLIETE